MKTAQNTITILEKSGFLFGFGPLPVTKLGRWGTPQLNKLLHSWWNGMVLIFRIPPQTAYIKADCRICRRGNIFSSAGGYGRQLTPWSKQVILGLGIIRV